MGIELVTGPANAGKAEVVMDAVRRHLAQGREPLLVVPTRTDVEYYLRELAGGEAAMGVQVMVFAGLIEEAVARAGIREAVIGGLARERLIGALGGGSDGELRPGFRRALGELFAELQVKRVAPQRLASALDSGLGGEQAALGFDLAASFGEYHRRLQALGRLDEQQRALRALDGLRERPALWGATPVLFYGFDDLTPIQLDTIETLGSVLDVEVTVSLAYEPGRVAFAGRAGTFQTLAPIASEHQSLSARSEHYAPAARAPLAHLERNLFETGAARTDPGGAIELMQGGGERAELELIAARVATLLGDGVPAEEIAVVVRRPAATASLLSEVFAAARIPFAMPLKRRFGDTAIGRALIGLLRCVPAPGDGPAPGTPADLLAWLRAPGRLDRPELADSLELEVRRHGLRRVEQARARWEERRFPLETIDRLAAAQRRGPGALAEQAARELTHIFEAPLRGRAEVLSAEGLDEARALAGGRSALAELRELARVAADAAPSTAAELAEALAEVEVNGGQLPAPGLVAVLDPLALRARRVRVLFLAGMQEGEFPQRARPHSLLGDRERTRVAQASGLILGEGVETLTAERYLLYALVSRPLERLVLSWHETDDDAGPLSRSLFIDDICDLFDERLSEQRARRALGALDLGADRAEPLPLPAAAGLLDERVLALLRDRVWSATSLEKWIGCPVAWYVERLLAPGRFEPDPEPFARGTLGHEALNETFEQLGRETGTTRVTAATLERAQALLRRALEQAAPRYVLSVSPERSLAIARALGADLERYLQYAAEAEGEMAPRHFELAFGSFAEDEQHGEPSRLPAFDLGGGVQLRGRIDRIDIGPSGEALVIDYKGAEAPRSARWIEDGKLQVALYMQAAEALLGVRVVGGLYQPLRGEKIQARGAILAGHEAAASCTRTDRYEPDALDELLAAALESAREAAGEAAAGELEPRPSTCAYRGGCLYPSICRCER